MRTDVTLERVPEQRVQLGVELGFLLQHVKEQLVLGGAGDLRLLQPALHHLHLRLPLGGLEALETSQACDLPRILSGARITSSRSTFGATADVPY